MKLKLVLTCAVVAASLCLFACTPKQASVDVSWDDFKKEQHISKQVEVAIDGSLTIALYSCPSEGRQWSEAQISAPTVLREVDHKYEPPPEAEGDMPPPPGTPGQEVWTFKALKQGTSTISLEYTHPWEGGEEEPMLTFVLSVVVK